MRASTIVLSAVITFAVSPALAEQQLAQLDIDITQASIEDLLNIKITSASKKAELLAHVSAAIYVLTSDDIRRSGVTSIPEALRLAPGVQVARVDANKWAVSIRGFNSRSANKLLVLINGRSTYDPLFTGVFWETVDVMLEDVERIEVIRGPGGTVWGANAVNGVINIITKHAKDTQGGLVAAGAGTEEEGFVNLRYGFNLAEDHDLRVYGKILERDAGFVEGVDDPQDDSRLDQAGFRYDGQLSSNDTISVSGNFYDGEQGSPNSLQTTDNETSGQNLSSRWSRTLSSGGQISANFYYDHFEFDFPDTLGEKRDTFDFEFQHQIQKLGAHQIMYGLGYRRSNDDIDNSLLLRLEPASKTDETSAGFIQDEIELSADSVFLTLGSKFESNDYTGSETLPNIRLEWRINDTDILWGAVSKAVRIPSRLESDFFVQLPSPIPGGPAITLRGNESMVAEKLIAYESGLRFALMEELYLDLAVFLNNYDDLVTNEGLTLANKAGGDTKGLEIAATYLPLPSWKLIAGYSYLKMDLELDADSLNPGTYASNIEGNNPEHQAFLRSSLNFSDRHELDIILRYVDRLPTQDVPSYTVADIRWATRFGENMQLSLVGQNLLEQHHFEQRSASTSEVEDGLYLKILYQF
jgi:iron complex outermembrane receptor protein